jgi:hypothetical protein
MSVEQAQGVVTDLQTKQAALAARRAAIDAELKTLGYRAHVEGDRSARTAIAKLNAEAIGLAGDEAALQGALAEARNRLTAAQRQVAAEAEAKRAAELADVLEQRVAIAREFDAALAKAADAGNRYRALEPKLRALGLHIGGELADVTMKRAVLTGLLGMRLPFNEPIAPNQRTTLERAAAAMRGAREAEAA